MTGAEDAKQTLEELSESLVLVEPSDLVALANMHTHCQSLAAWAKATGLEPAQRVMNGCADLIEKIILSEAHDPAYALDLAGQAVGALQSIVRDGRDISEVQFPKGIFGEEPIPPPLVPSTTAPATPTAEASISTHEPRPLEGDLGLLGEFVSEAREHLEAADLHLLTLETEPEQQEALNAVFRAFHTIKGVAGFLALEDIQHLAHEAENLLDKARKDEVQLVGPCIDVTFDSVDMLKRLVQDVSNSLSTGALLPVEPTLPQMIQRIRGAIAQESASAPPQTSVFADPGQKLGEVLVDSGIASPEAVYSALKTQEDEIDQDKLGEMLVDLVLISRAQLDEALEMQRISGGTAKLGQILVEIGALRQQDLDDVLHKQQAPPAKPRLGEVLVQTGGAEAKEVAQALRAQQQLRQPQGGNAVKEPVKVDAERLDRLVDLIGELVIAESMVSQSNELLDQASPPLMRQVNQLDKITRELQEMGTGLRMVPVRGTFQKMARLVRDVAKKANKRVEFLSEGDDTELDKTVVDKIGDPLVHMVRNAVDHGLEATAEERRAAGKPEVGKVVLRAYHKGGSILIEIEDDGRGLDRDAILAKAKERGLIREGEALAEREIWNLIFEPGFSTAKVITDVSGRGVGMDVVRRNIESLRGQMEIRSERGKGSNFSIRLPLTLAIIDGMVVRVGKERYIIPTLSVVRSIRPEQKDLFSVVNKGEMLSLQGNLIPMFRLNRLFNIKDAEDDPTKALVVIVEDEGRQAGLLTDELLGEQQIVIKSLGDSMQGLSGISGGAIMSDGRVGLILDVGGIVRLACSDTIEGEHQAPWPTAAGTSQ